MFCNFSAFYRPNNYETHLPSCHCQSRPLLPARRMYIRDYRRCSEKLVYLIIHETYLGSVSVLMERWKLCRMLSRPPWPSGRLVYLCQSLWSSTRPPPSSASSWRNRLLSCWRVSLPTLPLKRQLKQVWFITEYLFRVLNKNTTSVSFKTSRHCRPDVHMFFFSVQMFTWSLIKNSFMSLWHTTSMLVTFWFWRSWPKIWTCPRAATGWPCSIQGTFALLTTRSLFSYLPCQSVFGPLRPSLTLIDNIPAVDAAGHVPVCTSEWRRAGAGAWRLHLHVACGAEHRQRGLGVRNLAGHGAVGPAAWELHQSSRWVRHLGRPWVRNGCFSARTFSRSTNVHRGSDSSRLTEVVSESVFLSVWRSGPTQFSIVHLHLTPAALLAGYYSMESSVTVCSTALWMLPAPLASALRCRCNIQPLASGSLSCVYW